MNPFLFSDSLLKRFMCYSSRLSGSYDRSVDCYGFSRCTWTQIPHSAPSCSPLTITSLAFEAIYTHKSTSN